MEQIQTLIDQIRDVAAELEFSPEMFAVTGVGIGVLILYFGVTSIIREENPAAARIAAMNRRRRDREERGLLRPAELDANGVMKHLLPADDKERTALQRKLYQAGFSDPSALRNFMLFRLVFGLLLPAILLGFMFAARVPQFPLPPIMTGTLGGLSNRQVFISILILVWLGYYAPNLWLKNRITERSRNVEQAFPNALDLLQVSLEAGLGFDAAMTRVGNELTGVAPQLAGEFLTVQRQVQAGRPRDQALKDMAERTGVETVRSFTNVVTQSMQFGTPMTEALMTYSKEMRDYREMKAQEMANKLPVKLSAVLASMMLPALILLTIGPTVIRYIRHF
ncbi:MAG: type II secretion system F family protein [Pseudomonadota bacterium]